jgi:hypothetical protein
VLRSRTHKNLVLDSAIIIIKIGFLKAHLRQAFKKPILVFTATFGAGNTKIGFIMRIAVLEWVTEI